MPSAGSEPPNKMPEQRESTPGSGRPKTTRTGVVWLAVAVGLVLLVGLIIFILQNQERVQVHWLGLQGSVPLGVALFIASVGGAVIVAVAGIARVAQLRLTARRARREPPRS